MNLRRVIFIFFMIAMIFAVAILIWYFFIKTPNNNTSINNPTNPFGQAGQSQKGSLFVFNNQNNNQNAETEVIPGEERKLTKIWDKPTAGFVFVDQTILVTSTTTKMVKGTSTEVTIQQKATSTKMLFVDRTSGYVYGVNLETKKVYQISNSTIPGVYDAYFFDNGSSVIVRYLDNNGNIVSTLSKVPNVSEESTPQPLVDTTYLLNNINSVAVSNSKKIVSYLVVNNNGSSIYSIKNNKNELVSTSPTSEFNLTYGGENLYTTSKPSAYVMGYTTNVQTAERTLGNKTGLITLPANNNDDYLGSMWSNSGLLSFIFSKKTVSTKVLGIKTIASKCAWGKTSFYVICGVPQIFPINVEGLPDDWYQGRNQFTDDVYLIGNKTNNENKIFDFSTETKDSIDLIKPDFNSNNDYLSFINKRDGNLWLLHTRPLLNGIVIN